MTMRSVRTLSGPRSTKSPTKTAVLPSGAVMRGIRALGFSTL